MSQIKRSGMVVPEIVRSSAYTLKSMTFEEHFEFFRKKLIVTGTNLEKGETQIFSCVDTPNFPVADAVRISMGLPWVYKPYVIREKTKGWPAPGVYADGGLWNNLPYREFDRDYENLKLDPKLSDSERQSIAPSATLGLRLELTRPKRIADLSDLAGVLTRYGLLGSGETQVLNKNAKQMIILDTRGLDLLNFSPDDATKDRVSKRSRRKTWMYFDKSENIPREDQDQEDELNSSELEMEVFGE
jgi:hypothetical protein